MKDKSVAQVKVHLLYVRMAIAKIRDYTSGGEAEFFEKGIIQDAVIANLQAIGEASTNIPEAWKADYPEISWVRLKGLRNVLSHQYLNVDVRTIWSIIQGEEFEALRVAVERMLERESP